MNKDKKIIGIVLVVFSATLFGTSPMVVNFLRSEGMGIFPTLFTGCIQCIILYFAILVFTKKLNTLKINRKLFMKFALCAILFYATLSLLFFSYTIIPSGLATVIHFIYPSIVAFISIKSGRDKMSKPLIVVIICTFFGVILVSDPSNQNLNMVGILLAVLSAFVYSGYIYMINDESFKKLNNTTFVFYVFVIGGTLLLLAIMIQSFNLNSPTKIWGTYSNKVLIGALGLGITQSIGVILFSKGVKYVGGSIGGALAAFEPLTAVLIGVSFFSESLTLICVIGCLLILLSTVYLSYSQIKE